VAERQHSGNGVSSGSVVISRVDAARLGKGLGLRCAMLDYLPIRVVCWKLEPHCNSGGRWEVG
jgi:hypothetical protein